MIGAVGRSIPPLLSVTFIILWWMLAGPRSLGGPATFAVVTGQSMKPTYFDGDLVIAREKAEYEIGDVIVFPAAPKRVVIHRIVEGNAADGWITQGDNNDVVDSWTVPDDIILGEKWREFSGLGRPLLWTQSNPYVFGLIVAGLVLLSSIRLRLRPLHPSLREALRREGKRRVHVRRPLIEVLLLIISLIATVMSLIALGLLAVLDNVVTPQSLVVASIGLFSGVVMKLLIRRLGDGWRIPEPKATRYILSGQFIDAQELPAIDVIRDCRSAHELRTLCEKKKIPILRHFSTTGVESYLTVTRDGIGHRWTVAAQGHHCHQGNAHSSR